MAGNQRQKKQRKGTELIVRRDGSVERIRTRRLGRQLVDAASQPVNLLALAALVLVQVVLGLHVIVTLLVFTLLVTASLVQIRTRSFSPGSYRAREAVMHLPPTLRTRVLNVLQLVERVLQDVDQLEHPPEGVEEGLDQLVATLIETAQQAASVDQYLNSVQRPQLETQAFRARQRAADEPGQEPIAQALEEQLAVVDRLHARRREHDLEMERISANLGVLHARIVQACVESEDIVRVDDELVTLRDRTRALAEGMREVREIETP